MSAPLVTVVLPYYRCAHTVRRAATHILNQTCTALRLVVVNDGDTATPPWPRLSDLKDRRIVRCDLPTNMGRYHADAVALAACDTPWYVVHDADDWAEPTWLASLLARASATGADAVLGPQWVHRLSGRPYVEEVPLLAEELTPYMRHLAHHAGLYRTDILRQAGGWHPGYRVGYDTLLVNLVRMVGTVDAIRQPQYHRVARRGSLTTAPRTRFGSELRAQSRAALDGLYARAYHARSGGVGAVIHADIAPALADSVTTHAGRLRGLYPQVVG